MCYKKLKDLDLGSSHVLKEAEGKLPPCSLYRISSNGLIELFFTSDLHREVRWGDFHKEPEQSTEGYMEPNTLETTLCLF